MNGWLGGTLLAFLVAAPVVAAVVRRRGRQARAEDARASDASEELTRLTAELAHEIKNPLSTIKVNLKLTEEALDEVASQASPAALSDQHRQKLSSATRKMTVIQKELDRLENILEGFLRYVRRPDLQLATMDINELVGDMVDFYSPQAYRHALTVRQSLSKGPLVCRVDPGALKQVLLNLFINAQQAMDGGGEMMIRTARQGEHAIIQVNDTGKGISPERLPTIFTPYSSSRTGGTGLGLATARKIVEAHQGTISVHSELGKGTSFTIDLPFADPGLGPDSSPSQ